MSVGILGLGHLLVQWLQWLPEQPSRLLIDILAAAIGFIGANLAVLHLGRPLQAYRAWLGWRTSWLSREVLAFGAYVPAVIGAAGVAWIFPNWSWLAELAALVAGILAIYSSAMIYISTRRPWWSASLTLRRFALTAFVLGNSTCAAVGVGLAAQQTGNAWFDYRFPLITLAAAAAVAVWRRWAENSWLAAAARHPEMAVRGCAQLLRGELRPAAVVHRFCALSAGFVLPVLVVGLLFFDSPAVRATITLICVARVVIMLASEIADRYLFFAACVSPRMPGVMLR
jgi:DMSO reductase anchor subunit